MPLGLFYASKYEVTNIQLVPGETLLFYTDGVTEARNGSDTADIREIEITGDQYKVIAFRVCSDGIVRRIAHPNIADIYRLMP